MFWATLLGQNHVLTVVMVSVTSGVSCLKINLHYLKKADQVTKQIPWDTFQFKDLDRVVIFIFFSTNTAFSSLPNLNGGISKVAHLD